MFDTISTVSKEVPLVKVKRSKPLLVSLTRERTEFLSSLVPIFAEDREISFE